MAFISNHSDFIKSKSETSFPKEFGQAYGATASPSSAGTAAPSVSVGSASKEPPAPMAMDIVSGLVVLLAILTAVVVKINRRKQAGLPALPVLVTGRPTSPCRRCRFFEDKQHLQCAVNPQQVLTSESEDCRDYEQNYGIENRLNRKLGIGYNRE